MSPGLRLNKIEVLITPLEMRENLEPHKHAVFLNPELSCLSMTAHAVYTGLMLTFEEYVAEVKAIPYGKRVGKNVYVLWPELKDASPVLGSLLSPMGNAGETTLIKFFLDHYKVSFLQYPDFFDHPHPALHSSETVNLTNGKRRTIDYHTHKNPPILHRKETMISPERPEYEEWKALTEKLEKEGLYEDTKRIGFKEYWDGLLRAKGLAYKGHRLSTCDPESKKSETEYTHIDRHKTAMSRADFSRPVQLLLKHRLLSKNKTLRNTRIGNTLKVNG